MNDKSLGNIDNNCVFCKIISGTIKSDIIKETNGFIVIKDINAVAPLHFLIISKTHYDSIVNTDALFNGNEFMQLVKEISKEYNLDSKGFRIVINTGFDGGQTVMHFHAHLMAGRNFTWPPG
ncbi:MAG: HIT domain-containing protein [bacterium]